VLEDIGTNNVCRCKIKKTDAAMTAGKNKDLVD